MQRNIFQWKWNDANLDSGSSNFTFGFKTRSLLNSERKLIKLSDTKQKVPWQEFKIDILNDQKKCWKQDHKIQIWDKKEI